VTALVVTLDARLILAVVVKPLTAIALNRPVVAKLLAANVSHPADAKLAALTPLHQVADAKKLAILADAAKRLVVLFLSF
jgi:hypothetical protein